MENRFIEWSKFQNLEKKYSKLCYEHLKQENQLIRFKKLPQAVFSYKDGVELFIKRVKSGKIGKGIIYLKSSRIKKNCCDICGKRRKTTAHHIIPKRVKSINRELSTIRIRICNKCKEEIHPENGYSESEILRKQEMTIRGLKKSLDKKALEVIIPFKELLNKRINEIEESRKIIPHNLKDNPGKIEPALRKCGGRIKELKFIRGFFRNEINVLFNTTK